MTELNGCEPRKVSVKGPYTFTIGDTTNIRHYKTGGIFTQVKMPKIIEFVSHRAHSCVLNSIKLLEIPQRVVEGARAFCY